MYFIEPHFIKRLFISRIASFKFLFSEIAALTFTIQTTGLTLTVLLRPFSYWPIVLLAILSLIPSWTCVRPLFLRKYLMFLAQSGYFDSLFAIAISQNRYVYIIHHSSWLFNIIRKQIDFQSYLFLFKTPPRLPRVALFFYLGKFLIQLWKRAVGQRVATVRRYWKKAKIIR